MNKTAWRPKRSWEKHKEGSYGQYLHLVGHFSAKQPACTTWTGGPVINVLRVWPHQVCGGDDDDKYKKNWYTKINKQINEWTFQRKE